MRIQLRPVDTARAGQHKGRGRAVLFVLLGALVAAGAGAAWWFWPELTDEVAEADWKEFTPEGGRCTVLLPGQPVRGSVTVNGVAGTSYALERARGRYLFALAWVDVPNVRFDLQTSVNSRREQAAKSFPEWKVDASMGAPPVDGPGGEGARGQEFTVAPLDTSPDTLHYTERVYVVPSRDAETMRLYLLSAKDSAGARWQIKFFNSLTIHPEEGAAGRDR
jgi:hypothetical protein